MIDYDKLNADHARAVADLQEFTTLLKGATEHGEAVQRAIDYLRRVAAAYEQLPGYMRDALPEDVRTAASAATNAAAHLVRALLHNEGYGPYGLMAISDGEKNHAPE